MIDTNRLIEEAQRQTGLTDFGGVDFRGNLGFVAECILRSDPLPSVWPRLSREWTAMLATRLKLAALGADEQPPPAPALLITGLPRTGSTFLDALLAQDPSHRVIEYQDLHLVPNALETLETNHTEFQKRHLTEGPLADYWFMGHEFLDMAPQNFFNVPDFAERLLAADQTASFGWHRLSLQSMDLRKRCARHLLDDPPFMLNPREFFAAYPDVKVIFMHRDPVKVLPSLASLFAHFRERNYAKQPDLHALGAENERIWSEALRRMLAYRDELGDESRFFDVNFKDLNEDAMSVVRAIYAHFRFQMTVEAEAAMSRWAEKRRRSDVQKSHGTHVYRLEDYGYSADSLSRKFRHYRERFGIEPGL